MNWNGEVNLGNLIAALTAITAVLTLAYNIRKEAQSREADRADRLRVAAAGTVARIDRYIALRLRLYDNLQPTLVETTEVFASKGKVAARDFLWSSIARAHATASGLVHAEDIEAASIELASRFPAARDLLKPALEHAEHADRRAIDDFQTSAQDAVLEAEAENFQTAILGNQLREVCALAREKLHESLLATFRKSYEYCLQLATADDDRLLARLDGPSSAN